MLSCPPPGDLPNPRIKPSSLKSSALASGLFTTNATWEALMASVQGFIVISKPTSCRPKNLVYNFFISFSIDFAVDTRKRKKVHFIESFTPPLSAYSLAPFPSHGVCLQSSFTHVEVQQGQCMSHTEASSWCYPDSGRASVGSRYVVAVAVKSSLSHVWCFVAHGLQHSRLPCPKPSPGVVSLVSMQIREWKNTWDKTRIKLSHTHFLKPEEGIRGVRH